MEKVNTKKQPGLFLKIMVLFLIVGDIQIPYYLANSDALHSIYGDLPSWYALYVVLGLASNVAIIIGMWKLKKWAIYLLIAYFATKLLVDFLYLLPAKQMIVFATTVAGSVLWFWAIYRKRHLFD